MPLFRLARFSLANRVLVALVTLLIAGLGVFSMSQLRQELIPSIELPQTTVVTTMPGASPEVVDGQVSQPLSSALESVPEVELVSATSSSGMSVVTVSSSYGADADDFRASIEDALDGVSLPEDAEPQVAAGSTSDIPIVSLTASAPDLSEIELTTLLEETVVPELEAVADVRDVTVSGAALDRIVITPDQAALAMHGLSAQSITDALDANGVTLPLGSVEADGSLAPVQGGTPVESLDDMRAIPLASGTQPGTVLSIDDVADIEVVTEEKTSITRMNGEEALSLSVTAVTDGDVVGISHGIEEAIAGLSADHDELDLTVVFDQAPFIEESIEHLAIEGLLGLVFAVVVILIFLLSLSSTLVTAISIPLSVLATFIGLYLGGHSLNMLTLGALTIAIGRVVDDSIVVIENIKRHLAYGEERVQAILAAVREVAGAITSSTLTTVAVFVPIAFVGGMVGELFAPFALTVTIAMLSSLLVALTIVPVLSFWFLRRPKQTASAAEVRAAAEENEHRSWLQRGYAPVLRGTQQHPVVTLVASTLLLVITVSLVPLMKVDFLGSTGQNMVTVTQEFDPGTDLDAISAGAENVEDALAEIDGVTDVMMTAGSGGEMSMMFGGGGGTATFTVNIDPDADQVALQDAIRDRLAEITDAGEIGLSDQAAMGGFGGAVDVTVTADDEDALETAAADVLDALQDTPNAADVVSDQAPAQPVVTLQVDRETALQHGMTEMQVLGLTSSVLSPQSIGNATIDGDELRVFVDAAPAPETIDELRDLQVPTAAGPIPLSDIAEVELVEVATSIAREDGELVATVSVTPDEGELGAVTAAVTERLDGVELPDGARAVIGGVAEQQTESFAQLGLAMVVAVALVFLLLVATFRSLMQPLILLVSIPFAATGALALLLVTGTPLGISALIGMLMLIGIVVTNAIVLIDLVNQYRTQGQNVRDAVYNGARQRLRPILMTALATICALTPMALGVTGSSGFISQDLAVVVIGGLVSSTLLTLILVPVLYLLFEGRRERRASRRPTPESVDGVSV
ncbi:efflux RND transporter permease subunit [Microbacterium phosphatis]|uniref:efflux RND transporter permease subunit n=1 Tax=Microbacterium phosphatis TaxID=3140248 RepID=UPI003B9E14A7